MSGIAGTTALTIEQYTVNAALGQGKASWPTNFAGDGYAVVDATGKVIARYAFRVEALARAAR